MINTIINVLIAGVLGAFAIVFVQDVVQAQVTTAWPTILQTAINNIAPVLGIIVIILMFMLLTKLNPGG